MSSAAGSPPELAMPERDAEEPASALPQGTTIEQSVRLFKVFEALRSGDTAALKAATAAGDFLSMAFVRSSFVTS